MAGQGRSMALLVLVAFGLLSVVDRASAEEYLVGGVEMGWIIPAAVSKTYYEDWLADKTFVAGDVLDFQYVEGGHSVLQLSEEDYASCKFTNPLKKPLLSGNDKVTLTAGDHYFVCGVSSHCSLGQKFQISVSAKAAAGPSPSKGSTPAPASSPTSSPVPASASGLRAAGALVCGAFMVFIASLLL